MKSQQPADRLLRIVRQAVDQSTAYEPGVQTFLTWLVQKSESVLTSHRRAATRAIYYSLALDFNRALDRVRALDRDLERTPDRDLERTLDRDLDRDRDLALALDRDLDLVLALNLDRTRDLDRDRSTGKSGASNPELKLKIQALKAKLLRLNDKENFGSGGRNMAEIGLLISGR